MIACIIRVKVEQGRRVSLGGINLGVPEGGVAMSYSAEKLNEFRNALMEKQEALLGIRDTGDEAANIVELDQAKVGRLSRMDALQAQAMAAEANRRRDVELLRIESALKRIDEGIYGYCLKCDEEINPQRLKVDPGSPLCIDCTKG